MADPMPKIADADQLVLKLLSASPELDAQTISSLVAWWHRETRCEQRLLAFLCGKGVLTTQAKWVVASIQRGHLNVANVRVFITAQGLQTLLAELGANRAGGGRKSQIIVRESTADKPGPNSTAVDRQAFWDGFPRGDFISFGDGPAAAPAGPPATETSEWRENGNFQTGEFISFDGKPGGRLEQAGKVAESTETTKEEERQDWRESQSGDFIAFD